MRRVPEEANIQNRRQQGLHTKVFTPGKKLKQAYAVGRAISPGRGVGGTVNEWADRLLPFITLVDVVTLKIIAPREAEESWMQRHELFHQVDAVAVGLIL